MTPAVRERHDQFLRLCVEHEAGMDVLLETLVLGREDARELMQEVAVVLWRKYEEL